MLVMPGLPDPLSIVTFAERNVTIPSADEEDERPGAAEARKDPLRRPWTLLSSAPGSCAAA
jgi:hypothetical protein